MFIAETMSKGEVKPELLDSPHLGGTKMSSSLKERLKRNSRSFSSPISKCFEVKPLLMPENNSVNIRECSSTQNIVSTAVDPSYSLEFIKTCDDQNLLQLINLNLKKQINQNEEKLRKLELVEHYHKKNTPDDLVVLIKKWLRTSQESLQILFEKLQTNESNFQALLNMLNIDNSIIQYDCESNSFY